MGDLAWHFKRTPVLCTDLAPLVGLPSSPDEGQKVTLDVRPRPFKGAHRVEATWTADYGEARWITADGESHLAYTAVRKILNRLGLKRFVYVKVVA